MYLGDLPRLSREIPGYIQEAERRGDNFASVCLRTRLNFIWLVRDNVARAERELEEAIASWVPWTKSFQVPHWYAMFARAELAIYSGRPANALERIDEAVPLLKRSMILRVNMVAIEVNHLRGRALLSLGRTRQVATAARQLRRWPTPCAKPYEHLLDAGVAQLHDDGDACAQALRAAIEELEASSSALLATVAKRRLGQVIGGDEGRKLIEAADAWMRDRGVANPERLTAMMVPGWND